MADINVTIAEEQPINVAIVNQETIKVTVDGYSFLNDVETKIKEYLIPETYPNGTLTRIDSKTYETSNNFVSSRLKVWWNGIKEKYITVLSDKRFQFEVDIDNSDPVEVEYIKQSS